jgi:hypothetical protein
MPIKIPMEMTWEIITKKKALDKAEPMCYN